MANTFSIILVLATIFISIIWALDKFIWAPKRQLKIAAAAEKAKVVKLMLKYLHVLRLSQVGLSQQAQCSL